MSDASKAALDPDFVAVLCCPLTRSKLRLDGESLVAEVGGLRYPIRDGIPVMLVEEAILPEPFKTLDEFKAHYRDIIPR